MPNTMVYGASEESCETWKRKGTGPRRRKKKIKPVQARVNVYLKF